MASAAYQQTSTDQPGTEQSAFGAVSPGYNMAYHNVPNRSGAVITTPQQMGMQMLHPMSGGPTVVVTQPVVTVPEPQTQCALVMSVLSSIFCCFVCGITGILVSWRARMYVLDSKFEHARHSVSIVWILLAFTIFFGIITWAMVGVYIAVGTRSLFGTYYCNNNGCYYRY
ncbi:uncharacterized protein LOC112577228 [Pomacea canaliculata]|uniref:uncharacterized protein LOC112577228 n=1 Tax=Pomacea canaliculata TaxID=400727 RepID=UPI000D72BBC9|nr:uncharacterized protein LOC112577228 [Pomacea canaliculata]